MDECIDVPAEKVSSAPFKVGSNKQNNEVSAAEILLQTSRDCLKRFLQEVLHFLTSLVLTYYVYINELLALTEF